MPDLLKRAMSVIRKGCKLRCEKKSGNSGGVGGLPNTLWNGNSRGVGGFKLKNHPWGGGGGGGGMDIFWNHTFAYLYFLACNVL